MNKLPSDEMQQRILMLPKEISIKILLILDYDDVISMMSSCRSLYSFFKDEYFWFSKIERDFGLTKKEINNYILLRSKVDLPFRKEKYMLDGLYFDHPIQYIDVMNMMKYKIWDCSYIHNYFYDAHKRTLSTCQKYNERDIFNNKINLLYVKFLYMLNREIVKDSSKLVKIDKLIRIAIKKNNLDLVKYFLRIGHDFDYSINNAINYAASLNNYELLKALVKEKLTDRQAAFIIVEESNYTRDYIIEYHHDFLPFEYHHDFLPFSGNSNNISNKLQYYYNGDYFYYKIEGCSTVTKSDYVNNSPKKKNNYLTFKNYLVLLERIQSLIYNEWQNNVYEIKNLIIELGKKYIKIKQIYNVKINFYNESNKNIVRSEYIRAKTGPLKYITLEIDESDKSIHSFKVERRSIIKESSFTNYEIGMPLSLRLIYERLSEMKLSPAQSSNNKHNNSKMEYVSLISNEKYFRRTNRKSHDKEIFKYNNNKSPMFIKVKNNKGISNNKIRYINQPRK